MKSLLIWMAFAATLTAAETPRGYFRYPAIHGDTIVFTAEGDLWHVGVKGGLAQRLTTHPDAETAAGQRSMKELRIKAPSVFTVAGTLSGGNQQKVVLARWLTGDVNVLLLDEPTRGVDVGARSEIYRIITEFAANGTAVVMASSDMLEVVGLSHRAFVMRAGLLVGELDRDALDHPAVQESVFRLATALDATPTGLQAHTDQEAAS